MPSIRRQACLPQLTQNFLQVPRLLEQSHIQHTVLWCNRRDERDDRKFADKTARRDGRTLLELAFERNPAVLMPYSPEGKVAAYFLVTRPPEGGARLRSAHSMVPVGRAGTRHTGPTDPRVAHPFVRFRHERPDLGTATH